ncbi:MAG: Fe-S-containing protein [Desulfitobacteriaceae bacterium]
MFESLVITLREGIEAALVIGIILTYLKRTGKDNLNKSVYAGVGLAILGSIGAALIFQTLGIDAENEYFQGIVKTVAGLMVLTMVIWMWKTGKNLKNELEAKLENLSHKASSGATEFGLLAFTFVMVFREGVETVLFLSASSLSTGVGSFIGGIIGLLLAALFAYFFVKGTAKINLQRFFSITSVILLVLVVRLLLGGIHEFAERELIPISPWLMKVIGYIVRDKASEIITMFLISLPIVMVLLDVKGTTEVSNSSDSIERRKLLAKRKREQYWKWSVVAGALLVNLAIGLNIYAESMKPIHDPAPVELTVTNNEVVVPINTFDDKLMHKFIVKAGTNKVRFIGVKTEDGKLGVGMDACAICGSAGYAQDKEGIKNLICKNCNAPIAINTIGTPGGCNPIDLKSKIDGSNLIVKVSDLANNSNSFVKK